MGQASLLGLGGAGIAPGTRWALRRSWDAVGRASPLLQQLLARRRTAESCSAEIIRIAAPTSKDVLEVLTCALKRPCSKAKDMYKYFEDLALTMYKNSVRCGVVWCG